MLNRGDLLWSVDFLKISMQNAFLSSIHASKRVEICGFVPALWLLVRTVQGSEFEQGEFAPSEGKVSLGKSKH